MSREDFSRDQKMFQIEQLQIETTSYCNLACDFCPNSDMESYKMMDMELFKKIIDNAAELKIPKVIPFLTGEPFVDPHIFKRIEYIKEKMPGVKIELYTNCIALTQDRTKKINELGIDFVSMSVNAANKDTYYKVCKKDVFDLVIKNAIYFIENSPGIKKRVQMVPLEIAKQDVEPFKQFWQPYKEKYGVEIQISDIYNWAGDRYNKDIVNVPCFRTLKHMTVLVDGRVNLCCMDGLGKVILGDLNKQRIEEVWEANEWRRRMHLAGKRPMLWPCNQCNMK